MKNCGVNLCQFNGRSCFGCCGFGFGSEKNVLEKIRKNTVLFVSVSLSDFVKISENSSASGGCRALIFKNSKIVCALHPSVNFGKDLRDKNCKKDYLCRTFKVFLSWSVKKQKKFVDFVESKRLSDFDFSVMMDKNLLLKDFKDSKPKSL